MQGIEYCEWLEVIDCEDDHYVTSCNAAQFFDEGGIKGNRYIYCPYCGKKIKEVTE